MEFNKFIWESYIWFTLSDNSFFPLRGKSCLDWREVWNRKLKWKLTVISVEKKIWSSVDYSIIEFIFILLIASNFLHMEQFKFQVKIKIQRQNWMCVFFFFFEKKKIDKHTNVSNYHLINFTLPNYMSRMELICVWIEFTWIWADKTPKLLIKWILP